MTANETTALVDKIYDQIRHQHLLDALASIASMAEQCGGDETAKVEQIRTSYGYLLSYFADGADDKARDAILDDLISAMLQLTDACRVKLLTNASSDLFYIRHAKLDTPQLELWIEKYQIATKKVEILTSVDESLQNRRAVDDTYSQIEKIETEIFNCIWAVWPSMPEGINEVEKLFADKKAANHFLCLIASALFLGCLSVYDEQKLLLLLRIYKSSVDDEIRIRCLVGFVLAAYCHQLHISHSRRLQVVIADLAESAKFRKELTMIWKRLIMSRNTENIKRRMNTDIISTINKLMPDSFKKSFGKDNVIDLSDIQANPEWQEAFEKSGLSKKLEEFNELQMSGGDVFLPTFSNLKSFSFFQTMSNWFLPFHKNQSTVRELLKDGNKSLERMITGAPLMCNSDKYSLTLSVNHIPQEIRDKMFRELESQNTAINDSMKAELSEFAGEASTDRLINSYVQDLYRFFKLFSRHREFYALFDSKFKLDEIPFVGKLLKSSQNMEFAADYYLNNLFYSDAISYYKKLLAESPTVSPMVYQKLGLAYQNTGEFEKALTQYHRYELADDANLWNIKHIAVCHRSLHQPGKALLYYKKADEMAPNKLATLLNMGHCLLDLKRNEEALEYYFKAELADDKHTHKAWRPIAWTAFLCGQYEQSEKYYTRILSEDGHTFQDIMNYGHLLYCQRKTQDAIKHYTQAFRLAANEQTFFKAFDADISTLLDKCPQHTDVQLLHDAIMFKSNEIL